MNAFERDIWPKLFDTGEDVPIHPIFFYGHMMCCFLLQLTRGPEAPALLRRGVGGLFHCMFQSSRDEHVQDPAVHFHISVHRPSKTIILHPVKIAFESGTLIYVMGNRCDTAAKFEFFGPNQFLISNSVAQPMWSQLSRAERLDEARRLVQRAMSATEVITTFSFLDPEFRHRGSLLITSNSRTFANIETGWIDETILNDIRSVVDPDVPPELSRWDPRVAGDGRYRDVTFNLP